MIHELKILSQDFDDILSGKKTFETWKATKDFRISDLLALNEFDSEKSVHTGRSCLVYIDYILKDTEGVKEGYVIMSIKPCYIFRSDIPRNRLNFEIDYSVNLATESYEDEKHC